MTYFCDNCGFLFSRVGEVSECPFCEGHCIRSATVEEAEHLREKLKREIERKMGIMREETK